MSTFCRVHAGGVVSNGAAALFVGPSGAGKSTIVVRLVTDGLSLLSDDEVWIEPDSTLAHPTWRSLLLKDSAWDLFPCHRDSFVHTGEEGCRSWWLDPDAVRPGCRAAPAPVATVVVLKPASGDRPVLEEIGQTEALNHILMESMNFPEVRDRGLTALVRVVRSARLFRLTKGDLRQSTELLSEVLP
jgi:hypothetical protein